MSFDYNDLLLEADDETKKEDEEKKEEEKKSDDDKESKKDDDKKDDSDSKDDDEYNDLIDSETSDDTDLDSETDTGSDSSDEYNDLLDDNMSTDGDDDFTADSSEDSDSSGDDYNALIMVKTDGEPGSTDLGGVYEKVAKIGYVYTVISNNMKHIHLNACGKKFEEIHRTAETYYNHFNYFADSMFELASESPLIKLDNPARAKEHAEGIEVEADTSYPFETAMARMSDNLNKAIECVKDARAAAGDSRTDIQSKLDEELSYLNKEFNYFLRKKMVADDIASTPIAPSDDDIAMESYNWLI
jgi:DNA-binding ferritin-like protein